MDLINRDILAQKLIKLKPSDYDGIENYREDVLKAVGAARSLSTYVEVTPCADCIYYSRGYCYHPDTHGERRDEDFYCANAEMEVIDE